MASGSRARGRRQQSTSRGHLLRLVLPSALLAFLCASALVPLVLPGRSHHPLNLSLGMLKRLRASVKRRVRAVTVTVTGAVTVTGVATIMKGGLTAGSQELSRKWPSFFGENGNDTRNLNSQGKLPHQHPLRPLPAWSPVPGTFLLGFCHLNRWSNRLLCMQRALVLASLLNRTLVLPQADVCAEGESEAEEGSLLIDIDHLRSCLEVTHGTPHAAAAPNVANPSAAVTSTSVPKLASPKSAKSAVTNAAVSKQGAPEPATPDFTARNEADPEIQAPKAAVPKVVSLEELLVAYGVASLQVDLLMCTGRGTYPAHCPPGECSAQGRVVYPSPTRPPLSLYDTSQLSVPLSAAAAEGAAQANTSSDAAAGVPTDANVRGPSDVSRRGLTSSQQTARTGTAWAASSSPPGGGLSAGAEVGTSDVRRGELASLPGGGLPAGAVVGTLARATRGAGVLSLGDLFYARVAEHDPEDWERAGSFSGRSPRSFLGALFGSPCKLLLKPAPEVFSQAARFMGAAGLGSGLQDGVDPGRQKGVGSRTPTYAEVHLRRGTFARYPRTTARALESPSPLAYAAVHLRRGDFGSFCRPPRCHFWSIPEAAACLGRHLRASGLRRLFLSSDGNTSEVGELRRLLTGKAIQVLRLSESHPQNPGGSGGPGGSGNFKNFGGSGGPGGSENFKNFGGSGNPGGSGYPGGSEEEDQHGEEGQEETELEEERAVAGVCSSPLACALVEKLVCAHATQLLWQDHSSFSAHILQLRKGLGRANPHLDRRLCAL